MEKQHYFITIVDKNIRRICEFSEIVEEKYDKNTLTGLNLAKTRDGYYTFGLVFDNKPKREEALKTAKSLNFKRITTKEENWAELITLAEMCIVGHFSYKMIK